MVRAVGLPWSPWVEGLGQGGMATTLLGLEDRTWAKANHSQASNQMEFALFCFGFPWDPWFLSSFWLLASGVGMSPCAWPTTAFWKYISCLVSQLHSWRGIQDESHLKSQRFQWCWDEIWDTELRLECVKTCRDAQMGWIYFACERYICFGGGWGQSVMGTIMSPQFICWSFNPQCLVCQKVTLLANRLFTSSIRMRSYWSRLAP